MSLPITEHRLVEVRRYDPKILIVRYVLTQVV